MAQSDIQVEYSYEELKKELYRLQFLVDSKEIKQGEIKAAKYLITRGKSALEASLLSHSDHLIKSFTYKLKKGKFSGVLVGFKRPDGNAAHLVDKGTVDRKTRAGANRGHIKGSGFWTNTRERYAPEAMDMIMNSVEQAIRKINNR